MKRIVLAGLLAAAIGAPIATSAQAPVNPSIGSVTLSRKVMADGQPLAAGTYQLRVSSEQPKPVVGQSPDGEKYVEFLKAGKVVARELATVVSNADITSIAKGEKPTVNGTKVELLKGNDYVRVWVNRSGSNYLLHLPVAS
jgi:hypothetical protein